MTTLGEAWIEVHADTKPFAKELSPKLKAILEEVEKMSRGDAMKVGQSLSQNVAKGVDKDSEKVKQSFRKVGNNLKKETKTWEKALAAPFERMARGENIVTRLFGRMILGIGRLVKGFAGAIGVVGSLGEALFLTGKLGALAIARFGEVVTGVGKDVSLTASKMSATAVEATAAFASFSAQAVAAAPALAAVVVVVVALSAAIAVLLAVLLTAAAPFAGLIQLGFLLPAAFSLILAVIAPLIIGFHNLGDAISLVFEKDPKKLENGLKKLSPVMQTLVGTLRPLRGLFDSLVKSVQTGLIGPILTVLAPTLKRIVPQLTVGFTLISQAIGNLLLSILRLVSQQSVIDAIVAGMGQIALFIEKNTPAITKIIEALGLASEAALPTLLMLLTKFTDFLAMFGAWIEGAITDGRFQTWLDNGIADLTSIWNLVKEIFGLFKDLFVSLESDGRTFLDTITAAIRQFRDWAKSPEGKTALEAMGKLAVLVAKQMGVALGIVEMILTNVGRIYSIWKKIAGLISGTNDGKGFGSAGSITQYSGGGVVPQDQVAMVHAGEPILDPANSVETNKSILADAGMLDVLSSPTVVNVYIGAERLNERIDYRIGMNNKAQTRTLSNGPRT